MNGKMAPMPWRRHWSQPGALAQRQHPIAEPLGLVGAQRAGPGEAQVAAQELLSDTDHALLEGEERLVLEGKVGEVVLPPQRLGLFADALGGQPDPAPLVHERVGAVRAAEVAAR